MAVASLPPHRVLVDARMGQTVGRPTGRQGQEVSNLEINSRVRLYPSREPLQATQCNALQGAHRLIKRAKHLTGKGLGSDSRSAWFRALVPLWVIDIPAIPRKQPNSRIFAQPRRRQNRNAKRSGWFIGTLRRFEGVTGSAFSGESLPQLIRACPEPIRGSAGSPLGACQSEIWSPGSIPRTGKSFGWLAKE